MGHINFVLDFRDIICLYLYFFFPQGECDITVALLAHDYTKF